MTKQYPWRQSPISKALDDVIVHICELERTWTCDGESSGIAHVFGDLRHHVCSAMAFIDPSRIHGFEDADEATRVVAHEAYLAVMSLASYVRRAEDNLWADPRAIDAARVALDGLLDALAPHVSRADTGLREVMLEDVPLETVLGRLAIA